MSLALCDRVSNTNKVVCESSQSKLIQFVRLVVNKTATVNIFCYKKKMMIP